MLVREGIVTHGYYINDEWIERIYTIEAQGETNEELDESVDKLTVAHTRGGSTNKSGNSTETEHIKWSKDAFNKTPVDYRSEVFEVDLQIHRSHCISAQYDSTIVGRKKWIASYKSLVGYGDTKTDAVSKVTKQITGKSISWLV